MSSLFFSDNVTLGGSVFLIALLFMLMLNILTRKRAEKSLQKARDELEFRVAERTAELESANEIFRHQSSLSETTHLFDEENIIFEKAMILAVDDIESNRNLVKAYFQNTNIHIIEAENGQQALLFAEQYLPQLILMDIRMPVMDGYEAVRRLKEDENLKKIPVIALTASALEKDKEKIIRCGFDDYLIKPVRQSEVFEKLSHFLRYSVKKETEFFEKNSVSPHPDSYEKLPPEIIEKMPEIIEQLENRFTKSWISVCQNQIFDNISLFAKEIKEFGEKYSLEILITFGKDLMTHVSYFDIDSIDLALDSFPRLIENIRASAKTSGVETSSPLR